MFISRILEEADHPIGTPFLWSAIVGAAIAEVRSGATEEQARGFFHALGQRIAGLMPVDDIEDLEALSHRVNRLWAELGWGGVTILLGEGGVDLHHAGVPVMPAHGDEGHWPSAAGAILEGAYDRWFRALGSHANLHTRVVHQADGQYDLRHAP